MMNVLPSPALIWPSTNPFTQTTIDRPSQPPQLPQTLDEAVIQAIESLKSEKDEGKAIVRHPSLTPSPLEGEPDDSAWKAYEPPEALARVPRGSDGVISHVVNVSIANVRARIEGEKAAQKEAARQVIDRSEGTKEVVAEENIPVTTPDSASTTTTVEGRAASGHKATRSLDSLFVSEKPGKRPGFLGRIFHRSEKGESSMMGASRRRSSHGANRIDLSLAALIPHAIPHAKADELLELVRGGTFGEGKGKGKRKEGTAECVCCLDDIPLSNIVKLVCHSYCKQCFIRLITSATQNEAQWPPKCCLTPVPKATILAHTPSSLKATYREKQEEWGTPAAQRIYCSKPSCSVFIKPDKINTASRLARCSKGHLTCTMCRGPQHSAPKGSGSTCPHDRDLEQADALATEEGWKRCISCGILVEHKEACQHMTCRCGAEFCYVCGLKWRTCQCTTMELDLIKQRAESRRAERECEEREREEAIRLVAEFEAEERRKTELLQERLRCEREERRIRELMRVAEVKSRYAMLREKMEKTREVQQRVLSCGHDRETQAFAVEKDEVIKKLDKDKQRVVREAAAAKVARIREAEAEMDLKFNACLAEQTALEADYEDRLKEFWKARCKTAHHVEPKVQYFLAMWGEQNAEGMKHWQEWSAAELARVKEEAFNEESVAIINASTRKADAMAALARREADEKAKKQAHWKWMEVVTAERRKMLADMEADELGPAAGEPEEDIPSWIVSFLS